MIAELQHDLSKLQRMMQAPRLASHRGEGTLPTAPETQMFDWDALEPRETSVRMPVKDASNTMGSFVLQPLEQDVVPSAPPKETDNTNTTTRPKEMQNDIIDTLHDHDNDIRDLIPAVNYCTSYVDQLRKAMLSYDDANTMLSRGHPTLQGELEARPKQVCEFPDGSVERDRNPYFGNEVYDWDPITLKAISTDAEINKRITDTVNAIETVNNKIDGFQKRSSYAIISVDDMNLHLDALDSTLDKTWKPSNKKSCNFMMQTFRTQPGTIQRNAPFHRGFLNKHSLRYMYVMPNALTHNAQYNNHNNTCPIRSTCPLRKCHRRLRLAQCQHDSDSLCPKRHGTRQIGNLKSSQQNRSTHSMGVLWDTAPGHRGSRSTLWPSRQVGSVYSSWSRRSNILSPRLASKDSSRLTDTHVTSPGCSSTSGRLSRTTSRTASTPTAWPWPVVKKQLV